jgi:hypothetical protein
MICPNCNGTGQVNNDKAKALQITLACRECEHLRVVPVPRHGEIAALVSEVIEKKGE